MLKFKGLLPYDEQGPITVFVFDFPGLVPAFCLDASDLPDTLTVALHIQVTHDTADGMRAYIREALHTHALARVNMTPIQTPGLKDALVQSINADVASGFDAAYDSAVGALTGRPADLASLGLADSSGPMAFVMGTFIRPDRDRVEPDGAVKPLFDADGKALTQDGPDVVTVKEYQVGPVTRPTLSYLGTAGPPVDGVTCYRFGIDFGPGSDTARRRIVVQMCFGNLDGMPIDEARVYMREWLTHFASERIEGFLVADTLRDFYLARLQSAMTFDFDAMFSEHFAPHTAGAPAVDPA